MESKVIMYDSSEAATYRTDLKGWVSRDGRYFGKDESTARWSGSTHKTCACGNIHEKHRIRCQSCQATEDMKKFTSLPVEKWDGVTPLCIFDSDTYFFDDSVLDYIADQPEDEEIRICKCRPGYLHQINEEYWADDLAEDGEIPDAVSAALDLLNKAIKEAAPVCWYEDAIAIDAQDLRARITQ